MTDRGKVLVTGGGGFIGSHLTESLLARGFRVTVLDNFSTGFRKNLDRASKDPRFTLLEGDIRDMSVCRRAAENCDFIFHEAALGSVPRSLAHPEETADVNVHGFVNMITAAKECGAGRFIYASSSSVYGDNADAVKTEDRTGVPLSPYAVSKVCNELFAANFSRAYGLDTIGLRYFNVFGARQNPDGPYAAVIPRFIRALKNGERPVIYGDGTNSRDFTHVMNVVNANLLCMETKSVNTVYNIACGESTSLNELFRLLSSRIGPAEPVYAPPRKGDIAFSLADISKAEKLLGYHPLRRMADLEMKWFEQEEPWTF